MSQNPRSSSMAITDEGTTARLREVTSTILSHWIYGVGYSPSESQALTLKSSNTPLLEEKDVVEDEKGVNSEICESEALKVPSKASKSQKSSLRVHSTSSKAPIPPDMDKKENCIYLPQKAVISYLFGSSLYESPTKAGFDASEVPASTMEAAWRDMAQNWTYPDFSVFNDSVLESDGEDLGEKSMFDVSFSSDTLNASFFGNLNETSPWPSTEPNDDLAQSPSSVAPLEAELEAGLQRLRATEPQI